MCNNSKLNRIRENNKHWDNKFGVVDHEEFDDLTWRAKEQTEAFEKELLYKPLPVKAIEGVGADAEVVTNARGGKQSKTPMAMHLLDPEFLKSWADDCSKALEYTDRDDCVCVDDEDDENHRCYEAIFYIAMFMQTKDKYFIQYAADVLEMDSLKQIIKIAEVLQYGASRYKANNWRLIPQEEHINHALIHIVAQISGDTQDKHLDHALCRLMMAYATEQSDDFEYNYYVDNDVTKVHEEG